MLRVDSRMEQAPKAGTVNPWPALVVSWVCLGAAAVGGSIVESRAPWVIAFLAGASVLATGIAVALKPRSSLVLLLAGVTAWLTAFIADEWKWDTAALALRVLGTVGIVASGVILLPRFYQQLVVSLLILFHFGGIVTAVTSADQPWVAMQLWYYVYRPYLQFMYLNNAYHFYSPEPGPAPLMWFRVEYENAGDGGRNVRWIKIPETDDHGNRLRPDGSRLWPNVQYTRRLSLAESINRPMIVSPINLATLARYRDQEVLRARDTKNLPLGAMPLLQDLAFGLDVQYREPDEVSKMWVAKYARHVAQNYPHQDKPHLQVTGVKVYRVTHVILPANYLAAKVSPNDPEAFQPYFMGEFDKEGNMKPGVTSVRLGLPNGNVIDVPRDPLLYWLIPIVRREQRSATPNATAFDMAGFTRQVTDGLKIEPTDYLAIHAGDVEGKLP